MNYKTLGNSNLNISVIGFGTMSLKPDLPDFETIIDAAFDKGINFFDTADLYDKGENEVRLGKALQGKRNRVIIATKAGNQWRPDGSGWDWNPKKDYIVQCAEQSLKRLQTDYIDLYQLHGGTIEDDIAESIEAFELLKQQGKILNYGLSSIRPNVIREHVKHGTLISVMTQYSLLDRRPEESTLSLLLEHNIGVLARGTVASGLLVDKPAKEYSGNSSLEVRHAAETIHNFSDAQKTPAGIAIQFVLANPAITSAVVGIRTMRQLEEAVKAPTLPPLTEADISWLKNEIPAHRYQDHR